MNIPIITSLCSFFSIWSLRDIIEILLISTIFYYFSRWLATHVTQKLVMLMYSYCFLIIGSYALSLPFIFNFLVASAPLACILIILMHQDMLQKNFVVPQRIIPASRDQSWIEALIQSCLISCTQNKDLTIVMQRHADISSYIKIGCSIDSLLHKELLLMLTQSSAYDAGTFIYLNTDGMLLAINSNFHNIPDKLAEDSSTKQGPLWQGHAISLSAKTDALIMQCNHLTSTFTIILRGTITPKITAHTCTQLIVDYVQDMSFSKKGLLNDNKSAYTQSSGQHRA